MIKKISGLLLIRGVTLLLLLFFNFLLVKYFAVDEVGIYYLLATIAYLGNAVVFVGADLILQKTIARDIQCGKLNKRSFIDFLSKTSILGSCVVFLFSCALFQFLDGDFIGNVIVCTLLTTSSYVTALFRNIYQTAAKSFISSAIQLVDTAVKLLTVILCVTFDYPSAQFLFLSYLALSSIFLLWLICYFFRSHEDDSSRFYFENYGFLLRQIFPIGSSGLLNWIQLQSYRPFLSIAQHNLAALGVISFLTNLGSTATNATMTVLSQLFLPKVYSSQGLVTRRYMAVIALLGVILALISLPCGWLFLTLAGKQEMLMAIYLIPVGVLQETINSLIGATTVHYTVKSHRLSIFPICTLIGVIFMLIMLFLLYFFDLPLLPTIGLALSCSQLLVIAALLTVSIKKQVFSYAKQ